MSEENIVKEEVKKEEIKERVIYSEDTKYRVMELKYNGLKNDQISKEAGVPVETIKNWFRTGGSLFEKYVQFKQTRLEELESESIDILRRGTWNSSVALTQAVQETVKVKTVCPKCKEQITVKMALPTSARIKAATEILNRIFGRAMENVKVSGDLSNSTSYEHLSDEQVKERISRLACELGIASKEPKQT